MIRNRKAQNIIAENRVGCQFRFCAKSVADLRGAPAPLRPKIFSISYSFGKFGKSYVGAPGGLALPPTGILDPPLQMCAMKDEKRKVQI